MASKILLPVTTIVRIDSSWWGMTFRKLATILHETARDIFQKGMLQS